MRTHGKSNEPWYDNYRCMMDRCYREKACNYANYGGRGIKVCDEWQNVTAFEAWAKESGFRVGLTLDRIDPDGDYTPENCRWATRKEQANNRRNTTTLEYNGERHTISEWAELLGVNRSTLNNRHCRGWSDEDVLKGERGYVTFNRC